MKNTMGVCSQNQQLRWKDRRSSIEIWDRYGERGFAISRRRNLQTHSKACVRINGHLGNVVGDLHQSHLLHVVVEGEQR